MELTSSGYDTTLPEELQHNVLERIEEAHTYAKKYVSHLVCGRMAKPNIRPDFVHDDDCVFCLTHQQAPMETRHEHLLKHLLLREYPPSLVLAALFTRNNVISFPNSALSEIIFNSWRETRAYWKKPLSQRALIEQTELKMTALDPPRVDVPPSAYASDLRRLVERFLLDGFCLEECS
jgi:hypothetical protein